MKVFRKLLLIVLFVSSIFGFISCAEEESTVLESSSERVSLNVSNADLIASITDNEKYLNKEYLYDLKTLDDNDLINVIITLDQQGLADLYNKDSYGFNNLSDYVNSPFVSSKTNAMKERQNAFVEELIANNYINKVNHSYTTLFNGISVTTSYGKYKQLSKSGYDVDFTISEVYSQPKYQIASVTDGETVTNEVNVYDTGIFDSSCVDYDGTNTAVAILDSGFDIHHTVFKTMPNHNSIMITTGDIDEMLKKSKAYSYHQNIKVQDVYVNDKIPFVYDYADKDSDVAPYDSNHGTHVAGIIGGKDSVITGVAVNTQLVLMKVFGDINNGAIQDDILAALEDAIALKVDAINLSLGSACGFSSSADNEYINTVYNKIESAGISLVVAASNDYSSGYGGENSNTNKASNPDSATVGSPGTYGSTIAVASISGVKSKYMVSDTGRTFFFNNANNSAGKAYDFYEMLYEKLGTKNDKVEIEYVTVPGVGKKINYSNIDVEGKIALVKRGETSFEEKAQVALSQGAIGCIIYNNIAGEVYMNAGSKLEIALCSISKDDGEHLASVNEGKLILDKSYLAGPFMSDFSSWGPVSDLSLKPEITAHGGSILSAVPGGGYEEISGTSMACPNLCGVIILVKQFLKEKYSHLSAVELTNLTNSLLMSTSTIVLDEQGNPYSPRKQGSGLGNLEYAVETNAYLSVDGQTKPKLELKDDPNQTGVYELKFNVHNLSNQSIKYNLTNFTMTETLSSADPEYVAEKAYMLNPTTSASLTGEGTIEGDVVTINPNGVVTINYTIMINDEEKEYMQRSFINGIYVEGFAVLESLNEDNIDLSIPFLAFFGDWTKAPMFDKTFYEVESEKNDPSILDEDKTKADYYATTPLGTYYYSYIIPLGSYVYEVDKTKYDEIVASEEHAAIGYNLETINGITTVYAGLLRNAKKMTTVIYNTETGETVYEHIKYDEHKAYFSGTIVPGYDIINLTAAELGLQNNTKYTFRMEAELDYGDGGAANNLNNTFEFSFYVDYQAPIITDVEFYTKYDKTKKENRYYADVFVYDNHYAQSVRPFTIVEGELVSLGEYVTPVYGEKGSISKVTIEITDYIDLLQYGSSADGSYKASNGLGFLVDDYALNQSYSYVTLPGTNTDKIGYKEGVFTSVSNGTYQFHKDLYVGDELDLTTLLTSSDETISSDPEIQASYFATLDWSSSNEDVIKVKNGKIEAVSKGTALITCTTMNTSGYIYSINLRIRVRDAETAESTGKLTKIEFTYFDTLKAFTDGPEISEIGETGDRYFFTEKPTISFYPSEQVQIGFDLEPWNLKNYELIWASSNEKVATVDDKGVVTALKEGSSNITLKVKVNGKTSSLVASTRVNVKSEFVIEGNTLVAYKGLGGNVVIPEDKGILYIGSFAFSLYTIDYTVKIEEDDYDAAKTPASNDSVKSVTIPADVLEIKKYAFYNCSALEKVSFNQNYEGKSCPYIREYAFAKCAKLTDIDLTQIDLIGERAFEDCTALENIDLTNVYAIGRQAFRNCTSLAYVDITNLRNAGAEVFLNCTSLKTIDNGQFTNFSNGMFKNSGLTTLKYYSDRIPDNCFENASLLTNVEIINNVVYVGKKAFANCTSLKTVSFAKLAEAEFIYEEAFADCIKLESITLPDSSFEIEKYAFKNCKELKEVIFNDNSYISKNGGNIFAGCEKLSTFTVNTNNQSYQVNNNLLLSKDGKTIVLAAPNFDYNDYLVQEGIEAIAQSAFSSIEKLYTLRFSNDLQYIGSHAFENCSKLNTLVVNENMTIDAYAFNGCTTLKHLLNPAFIKEYNEYVFANTSVYELVIENAVIKEGAFYNCDQLITINVSDVNNIGKYAFAECDKLTNITLNASNILEGAFNNCTSIKEINLENVQTIGDKAFQGCSQLKTVQANDATILGSYAFSDCKLLESIEFASIEVIGSYAFAATANEFKNKLTNITLGNSLKEIGSYAFLKCEKLQKVILGDSISLIGEYAFSECSALTSFETTSNLEVISLGMFAEDASLETVNVKGIKYIYDAAFLNCLELVYIDLTDTLEIGVQAFNNCRSLEEAILPNVLILGDGSFMQAGSITKIEMPKVESIGAQALSCIKVSEIKLPSTIKYIAPTAFYYNPYQTKFTNLDGEDTCKVNDYIILDQGVLYTLTANNKYLLSAYPTAKDAQTYEVLFNTVRIDYFAASENQSLETLILPDTLTLIGNMAFYNCKNLETVEFKSENAPVLEGTVYSLELKYEEDSEIYKLLNKYFQFNGYYPLHYGQFKDMIGMCDKLNIVLPKNANMASYEDILYKLYFDLENKTINEYDALNSNSLNYLNKVVLIPTLVTLSDEQIIIDSRTAYNKLDQDLTKYGYSQDYLDELYNNLVQAENTWKHLNQTRINNTYKYLIADIEKLGSTYEFEKISLYYSIVNTLKITNRDDKKYIDTTNVDSFKDGFDEYFSDLNEDINTVTTVTTLPTYTVNKVGLTVAATTGVSFGLFLMLILKKRWLG